MAYIFRRKAGGKAVGSWFLGYSLPDGTSVQRSLKTKRKTIADRALAQFVLDAERQGVGLPPDVCLSRAAEEFIASRGNLMADSITWYQKRLGLWLRTLPAGALLRGVGPESLEAYKLARGQQVSLRTVDQDMRCLSIFFRWCVEVRGWLPASPLTRGVRRVANRGEPARVALTAEQVPVWSAALAGSILEPVFLLAVHAGLRLSEIIHLDAEDVGGKLIRVAAKPWRDYVPKDYQEREVPLSPELRAWRRAVPKTGAAVRGPGGQRWNRDTLESYWRDMRAEKKLPPVRRHRKTGEPEYGVRIHELRNTFATLHVLRGTDLGTLAEALGHKHISTTDKYFTPQRRRLRQESMHRRGTGA